MPMRTLACACLLAIGCGSGLALILFAVIMSL